MTLVEKIKKLRAQTAAGVMEIKKALEATGGDLEKAAVLLKEQGLLKAEKKQDRETKAGLVHAYIHGGGRVGVLLEVQCETDFVARTELFQELVHNLALQIAAMDPADVTELEEQVFIKDSQQKVGQMIKSVVAATGENIVVRRFTRYALGDLN